MEKNKIMKDLIIVEAKKTLHAIKFLLAQQVIHKEHPEFITLLENSVDYLENQIKIREKGNEDLFNSIMKARSSVEKYTNEVIMKSLDLDTSFQDLLDSLGIDPSQD